MEFDRRENEVAVGVSHNTNVINQYLNPLDCAMLMTAFCKVKLFDDNLDLFEFIER